MQNKGREKIRDLIYYLFNIIFYLLSKADHGSALLGSWRSAITCYHS